MFGIWFYYVCFSLIAFLLVILWGVYAPDSPWAPWWKTNKKVARAAAKFGKITKQDRVYELGSGDGEFVVTVAREFGARVTGIEIDLFRHIVAKLRLLFNPRAQKNADFVRKNFYNAKFSDATVVYVYLVPGALMRLKNKLTKELKPGTRVISYRYEIPYFTHVGTEKKHRFHLYTV